jgi:ribosome-associated protein
MRSSVHGGPASCPTSLRSRKVGSGVAVVNIRQRYRLRIVADDRLRITPTVAIDASDLTYRVSRSGGPGGQHANTSDTRVEVSLDVRHCGGLTPYQRSLVMNRIGPVVRAVAADTRSQAKNRVLARTRLAGRLAAALRVSPVRRPTRASRGAREDRLQGKRIRSDVKRLRGRPDDDD